MHPNPTNQRFIVSPAGFDDTGAILAELGGGFQHEPVSWKQIKNWSRPAGNGSVLFLNCAWRFALGYGRRIAPALRDFVDQGGTLYASDWAAAAVNSAFPGMLDFDGKGNKGVVNCEIVDRGLQEIIGKQAPISFDVGAWRRFTRLAPEVRVFVRAGQGGSANAPAGLPIIVGFRHGKGHVLCTSFHNKAQLSEQERRLLRFLILQPTLAHAAADAARAMEAQQCQPGKEIYATVDRGKTSQSFAFDADEGASLLYCLNWTAAGVLRLTVKNPSGQLHFQRETNQPPLGCEASRAAAGRWSCEVSAVDVPYDNFPFVLTVASTSVSALHAPKTSPARQPRTDATSSGTANGFNIPPPPPPRSAAKTSLAPSAVPEPAPRIPPPPPPPTPNR